MIKVKALEWREKQIGQHKAVACGITYSVTIAYDEEYTAYTQTEATIFLGRFSTLTDAKAACQAHHEQHVLSMIEIQTGETA